jgi:cytochrome c-type protein NapB
LSSIVVIAALALVGAACESPGVSDEELGLSKTSVFATPDPVLAASTAIEPGENETLEAYFEDAPPMIPHAIEDFLPLKVGENMCLECHELPDQMGQVAEAGEPTPLPASHYTDLRRDPETVTGGVIGARFVCTQCHAPQTDAAPLVANTYTR